MFVGCRKFGHSNLNDCFMTLLSATDNCFDDNGPKCSLCSRMERLRLKANKCFSIRIILKKKKHFKSFKFAFYLGSSMSMN